MANWQRRLLGLGLPCLLAWAMDVALTLHGQPQEYWAGDYARSTEGAPFYFRLYTLHPIAGVGGHLLWIGLVVSLVVQLPEVYAVVLALAVAFGHTWGASTWVTRTLVTRAAWGSPTPIDWYQATNGLFLAAAVATGVGVWWVVRSSAQDQTGETSRLAGWQRWALITMLLTAAAAIVFVPW